jgi:hypothetical protein
VRSLEGQSLEAKQAAVPAPPYFITVAVLWLLALAAVGVLGFAVFTYTTGFAASAGWGRSLWLIGKGLFWTIVIGYGLHEVLRRRILFRRRHSIWAPVPEHASRLLDRLLGARAPYEKVEQLQADLAATADRPTEVNRSMRAGHLAFLVPCLFFGLFLMVGFPRMVNGLTISRRAQDIRKAERALQILTDDNALRDFIQQRIGPAERVSGWDPERWLEIQRANFPQDRGAIEERLKRDRRELDRQLQALNWLERAAWSTEVQEARRLLDGEPSLAPEDFTLSDLVVVVSQAQPGYAEAPSQDLLIWAWIIFIVVWPVLWVLWAFLWRGGLTYRLAGLTLVLANGHRALRIQCALRALLVWAPVAALLGWSLWLAARSPEWAELSLLMWFLAVGLLLGYLVLALWFPRRGLHDWLAGTYLVPK